MAARRIRVQRGRSARFVFRSARGRAFGRSVALGGRPALAGRWGGVCSGIPVARRWFTVAAGSGGQAGWRVAVCRLGHGVRLLRVGRVRSARPRPGPAPWSCCCGTGPGLGRCVCAPASVWLASGVAAGWGSFGRQRRWVRFGGTLRVSVLRAPAG